MRPFIRICLTLTLILILVTCTFYSTAHAATPGYEVGQIVIRLAQSSSNDLLSINRTYGTIALATLPNHSDIVLLQAPLTTNAEQLVQIMRRDVRLLYAELNYINENPEDGSSDRIYGWGDEATMKNQNSARALQLQSAQAVSRGGGTLVAIIDTGVQLDHPALSNSIEPLGFDFVDNDLQPADEANGLDDDGDGRVDELYGHGTHIAGIVHLVAPEARLLPVRVLNSDGRGNNFRTASAIVYAAQRDADVINLSLGTPEQSLLLRDAVEEAARLGAVVVAASGNLNTDVKQYPAAEACAVAVTSVNAFDKKSTFANYGGWIGVVAPGEEIYSAFPHNSYAVWSGTSMATPFVAGQAALLRSLDPELTLNEVGQLIGGTAVPLDNRNPAYRAQLGQGRIDFLSSLDALASSVWPAQDRNVLGDCAY